MALKILSEIGTDQGITSEAYVRISDYNLNKLGCSAHFRVQVFMSEADAKPALRTAPPYNPQNPEAKSQIIGDSLYHSFYKEIEIDTTCIQIVPQEIQKEQTITTTSPITGESTTTTQTITEVVMVEESVPCRKMVTVCDLSPIEGVDIFQFGYGKLKEKLVAIFGAENVVDC